MNEQGNLIGGGRAARDRVDASGINGTGACGQREHSASLLRRQASDARALSETNDWLADKLERFPPSPEVEEHIWRILMGYKLPGQY